MWVNAMSILPGPILALDLLQARSLGNAIKDILGLSRGDMTSTIARKQPALRASCKLLLYDLDNLWQQDHGAGLFELGIDGLDMQVASLEVDVLCLDLGHLAYTKTGSGQQEQDASIPIVLRGFQQGFELRGGQEFLWLHAHRQGLYPTSNF
jgi:hypothetical protein